ncbi:hypothetical protein [Gilvimarinus xylanilyticus]|uniref:Uncharacterized protein n=1 Tax=Gilvimarinus xylanilyticus TaxID=2944139 RepID=A0A9X2KU15_9GAMM|nr:hypothetical protein [Gilvimarinus xylanilyticus]MCP8899772.1 hypothetical protein [Gilvimarinus xylanilyticus]
MSITSAVLGALNERNLMRLALLTACTLILFGCGGASTENPPAPPPSLEDSTAPQISIDSNVESQWPGSTVMLSTNASDNSGLPPEVSVSCDRGSLEGKILNLPVDPAVRSVKCIAVAEDAGGNSATDDVVIEITPTAITLIDSDLEFFPGSTVVYSYEGPELSGASVEVTLGGVSISHVGISDNVISFIVPLGVEGLSDVNVLINKVKYSSKINVNPEVVIEDPLKVVLDSVGISLSGLREQNVVTDEMYEDLLLAQESISSLSENDLMLLAHIVYQLDRDYEFFSGGSSYAPPSIKNDRGVLQKDSSCESSLKSFLRDSAFSTASLYTTVVGLGMMSSGAGSLPGALVTSLGAWATYKNARRLKYSMNEVYEQCVVPVGVYISSPESDISKNSLKTTIDDKGILEFWEGEFGNVAINIEYGFENEGQKSKFVSRLNNVRAVLQMVRSAFNFNISLPMYSDTIKPANASDFSLTNVSNSNVHGRVVSTENSVMRLEFKFNDIDLIPENGVVDFSFMLSDEESGYEVVKSATLIAVDQPKLSVFFEGVEVVDGSVQSMESDSATINVKNVGRGTIELSDVFLNNDNYVIENSSGEVSVLRPMESEQFVLTYVGEASIDNRSVDLYFGEVDNDDVSFTFSLETGCSTLIYMDSLELFGFGCGVIYETSDHWTLFFSGSSYSLSVSVGPNFIGSGSYTLNDWPITETTSSSHLAVIHSYSEGPSYYHTGNLSVYRGIDKNYGGSVTITEYSNNLMAGRFSFTAAAHSDPYEDSEGWQYVDFYDEKRVEGEFRILR